MIDFVLNDHNINCIVNIVNCIVCIFDVLHILTAYFLNKSFIYYLKNE